MALSSPQHEERKPDLIVTGKSIPSSLFKRLRWHFAIVPMNTEYGLANIADRFSNRGRMTGENKFFNTRFNAVGADHGRPAGIEQES